MEGKRCVLQGIELAVMSYGEMRGNEHRGSSPMSVAAMSGPPAGPRGSFRAVKRLVMVRCTTRRIRTSRLDTMEVTSECTFTRMGARRGTIGRARSVRQRCAESGGAGQAPGDGAAAGGSSHAHASSQLPGASLGGGGDCDGLRAWRLHFGASAYARSLGRYDGARVYATASAIFAVLCRRAHLDMCGARGRARASWPGTATGLIPSTASTRTRGRRRRWPAATLASSPFHGVLPRQSFCAND